MTTPAAADELWHHYEAYHAIVYFAPEHRQACDDAGLKGGWMAYFASRAAPLGRVPATVVTALFYNFHPSMVARALPDAWSFADPATILAARYRAVDAALRRVLGDDIASAPVQRAATLATAAATAADPAGRPMFAANLAVDPPDEPHLALWHATTLLREHRGDGHVAALVAAEIDGCQAHVLQVAAGVLERSALQPYRGWSDDEWEAATAALAARGWLAPDGTLTELGRQARAEVHARTARLAAGPVRALGEDGLRELLAALEPLVARMRTAGAISYPNPIGVPAPGAGAAPAAGGGR